MTPPSGRSSTTRSPTGWAGTERALLSNTREGACGEARQNAPRGVTATSATSLRRRYCRSNVAVVSQMFSERKPSKMATHLPRIAEVLRPAPQGVRAFGALRSSPKARRPGAAIRRPRRNGATREAAGGIIFQKRPAGYLRNRKRAVRKTRNMALLRGEPSRRRPAILGDTWRDAMAVRGRPVYQRKSLTAARAQKNRRSLAILGDTWRYLPSAQRGRHPQNGA